MSYRFRAHSVRCTPKVTPYAGIGRYSYRGWVEPHRQHQADRARDLKRWLAWSRKTTIGQAKVGIGWLVAGGAKPYHFRLLDRHGREHGPRYTFTNFTNGTPFGQEAAAVDSHGKIVWLKCSTRIRIVQRQAEDPHSAACRAAKRAWRQGRIA